MFNPSARKQELYDRIRDSSMDKVVLEEMQKLGFWPKDTGKPDLPEQIIEENSKLTRELQELIQRKNMLHDRARLLKEIRRQKMEASRRKRQERKLQKEQEKIARAQQWAQRQQSEITYLGEDVSKGLHNRQENPERLESRGLPAFGSEKQLAEAIGIPLWELKFLAFNRKTATVSHYKRFYIPKKLAESVLFRRQCPG